jgi:holliday junction DNA helicase RuvA
VIGSLRGVLLERGGAGEVVVEVAGVGYRALVPLTALHRLGEPGSEVRLHTHLHVREDALTLYGFPTRDERSCFEALIGAHGVGPALALAILSVHRPDALREAVVEGDVDALCLVPGVGKKTAARLVLELRERLVGADPDDAVPLEAAGPAPPDGAAPARREVRAALASLGYGPEEIREAVRDLPDDGDVPLLLKAALHTLATVR